MSTRTPVCQEETLKNILKKLELRSEVRLTRLTEKEIQFWTRRKSPKKKSLTPIKKNSIAEQEPDSDQLSKAESQRQESPSAAITSHQAPISIGPYPTSLDINSKKTGIKRKSPKDISQPKKIKNNSKSRTVNNVQFDQRITTTVPSEQTGITPNINNNCRNFQTIQEENISQKPVPLEFLKKELVGGATAAPQTLETVEKLCDPFEKSSASVGEENSNALQMKSIEDLFMRLDSIHFSSLVMDNYTELSKQFSDAFKVMSEFDSKVRNIELSSFVSVMEKEKHINLLKQECQNILASNHSIGFSTVFSQMVNSFGISFRWELVILLYCKILQIVYKLNNIKNLKTFFEAKKLMAFLLALSNYKNDMVFKVLNLHHTVFASLINSTLSETFLISSKLINVDLGELNQQSDIDWKDKNSMLKDGALYSNELAYCKPINNCGIKGVVKTDLSPPFGSMQSISQLSKDQLLKSMLAGGTNHTQCPNVDPPKPSPAQYPAVALPKPSPSQNINIQQQKQQNCYLPTNNQYQRSHQVYPEDAHKGVHKYENNTQQQKNMQAVNTSLPNQGIMGYSQGPIKVHQLQNQGSIQQLGYSHSTNQFQPLYQQQLGCTQVPNRYFQQIPNEGLQSQSQISLQQSTQGYTQMPNKQLQSQSRQCNVDPPKPSPAQYPAVALPKPSPSQNINIQQQKQQNCYLPTNNQYQRSHQVYPEDAHKGVHKYKNNIQQQKNMQAVNTSLRNQGIMGYPQGPNKVHQLQNQGSIQQLGYSHSTNQFQPQYQQQLGCTQVPNRYFQQIPNEGLQSQSQISLQQSTQGYTQMPNKQLQSQSRQCYGRESPLVPSRDQQKNIIQHQQSNPSVTNKGNPPPYPGVSQQQQQSYSQGSATGTQAVSQFLRQQLSTPVQNVPTVSPIPNSRFQGNSPINQGIVNNSHPMALNEQSQYTSTSYQEHPVPQSNLNEYFSPKNHSQQNEMNRSATIQFQCMTQTGNVTPQGDPSVNFKIRLPFSTPRLADDKVTESAVKVGSVINMTPEPIKISKAVDLFPSPSKTSSVTEPTPSVTISYHPASVIKSTHQIELLQANRTLSVKPVEGLCARLPSMPLINKTTPPPTQMVNETLTDPQDTARLSSENGAVVEKAIKPDPIDCVGPIPTTSSSTTTSSTQKETSTLALSDTTGTTLGTTEEVHNTGTHIKAEVPDFLSVFGTCSRDNCSKAATKVCSGCMKANYCSTECQVADWTGQHESTCGND